VLNIGQFAQVGRFDVVAFILNSGLWKWKVNYEM